MANPEDQEAASVTTSDDESDSKVDLSETTTDAPEDEAQEAPEQAAELDVDARVALAEEEVSKFKDVALRAEAERENVRRRAARDVENAHKFGVEKLVQNLLPVVDSLEKAMEAAEEASEAGANKAIAEGVGLCHKMMLDVLGKAGVKVVDPAGEPFDPNLHQAMSMVENPDMEPNSVVAVIQKGYQLNDRLARPAMVMVSKAPTGNADDNQIDEKV